ncbi:MMPL family transporter [Nocardioides limicola]|uniref:MMPL family transporter n=1 Tax=Nocardioides limicola TaxID=2803368 RepID=UPI00193B2CF9|nr:MMPL family transporter [Nocardioides sp. DJM-14]
MDSGNFFSAWGRAVVRGRVLTLVAWIVVAGALVATVPSLEAVIARASQPVIPDDAVSVQTFKEMDTAFGGTGAQSVTFVVFVSPDGLGEADRDYYRRVVRRLERRGDGVTGVQDVTSRPELADTMTSEDGRAMYLPVGLAGGIGSPEATDQVAQIRELAAGPNRPAGLSTYVTGTPATIADLQTEAVSSVDRITIVTLVGIALILLLMYRSMVTAAIALITIGIALAVSRQVTAFFGLHVFDVSTFTSVFLTGVVLGAGTDFSIFLIGRYHEERSAGRDPFEAVRVATRRVGAVIAASGGTTIAASLAMTLADLGIFRTSGPAIAISVAVTLLTALTVTPALLALAGARGWAEAPARSFSGRIWHGAGNLVATRPVAVLTLGLLLLGSLAAFYPTMKVSFDERAVQPADTDSNVGYRALAQHFPASEILQDFVLIKADRDLRNPRDLAALEQAAASVARIEGVHSVRGVTRPTGSPLDEASLGHQTGEVGRQLGSAAAELEAGDTERLTDGAATVAVGAGDLAGGATLVAEGTRQAADAIDRFLAGIEEGRSGLGDAIAGAETAGSGSAELADGAAQLADALTLAHDQTKVAVDGLGTAHQALSRSLGCGLDPVCVAARDGIAEIHVAQRDQLLPGLLRAATAARQIADGNTALAEGLSDLADGLRDARAGVAALAAAHQEFGGRLDELADGAAAVADGADELADGAAAVSDGTGDLVVATQEITDGLRQAADFLLDTSRTARDPAIGGFHLPAAALDDPRMALALGFYLSDDGRTARLIVLSDTDPFGPEAMARSGQIRDTAETALRGTRLEGAPVAMTGTASANADLDRLAARDFWLVAGVALTAVWLILMMLLRSVVAPAYLLASVVISYAAAMGLSVLVWQHLLGHPLEWSVPAIAFVILIAVGADYNMLLVSRIREEFPAGARLGVARAVTATGGMITSAGVIFAVSFLAMMTGSVTTLAQIGFTIGAGLLLDTLVVRTLVVPSIAALLGRWNWWPSRSAFTANRTEALAR